MTTKKTHASWMPPAYEPKHANAVQALVDGTADEIQQKVFMDWLINECCKTYDLSYRPESDRDTAFAEGRRFVGLMVIQLSRLNMLKIRRESDA